MFTGSWPINLTEEYATGNAFGSAVLLLSEVKSFKHIQMRTPIFFGNKLLVNEPSTKDTIFHFYAGDQFHFSFNFISSSIYTTYNTTQLHYK